jgi:hypothetical protein
VSRVYDDGLGALMAEQETTAAVMVRRTVSCLVAPMVQQVLETGVRVFWQQDDLVIGEVRTEAGTEAAGMTIDDISVRFKLGLLLLQRPNEPTRWWPTGDSDGAELSIGIATMVVAGKRENWRSCLKASCSPATAITSSGPDGLESLPTPGPDLATSTV